jgi:SAM-dependent methyltransferase
LGLLENPDLFWRRRELSFRYISGKGLEIGALHEPLPVRDGVVVEYVDVCGREESITKFPDLNPAKFVEPTYIDDGFELSSIPDASQDFLIANHVLEHSPNPIQAMVNWTRVLKPDGVLFTAIPIADKCFDKGRVLTTLAHLVEDRELCMEANHEEFRRRNRAHYEECLTISNPAVSRQRGQDCPPLSPEELAETVDQLSQAEAEIHFHTFSKESCHELMSYFSAQVDPSMTQLELVAGAEIVSIMRKSRSISAARAA